MAFTRRRALKTFALGVGLLPFAWLGQVLGRSPRRRRRRAPDDLAPIPWIGHC
jgi:hypothetical protein